MWTKSWYFKQRFKQIQLDGLCIFRNRRDGLALASRPGSWSRWRPHTRATPSNRISSWERGKIKLCQNDRPWERLQPTRNQQQSSTGSHYQWHSVCAPQPKVPCTARVKVLLDSLVPVSERRWRLPHCPERGENWNVFSSCQHCVTLISFSDALSWHLERFDRAR